MLCEQLQDKATLLTAERKKRGKTIPEGLASAEDIRGYRQVASHVVCHNVLEMQLVAQCARGFCFKNRCQTTHKSYKYKFYI